MGDTSRLEEWLSQLESADRSTRLTAAHRLAIKGEAQGLPVLIDALKDGEAMTRRNIAHSLGDLDDDQAAETLFSLMTEDPEEKVRRSAGSALANKVSERAIPVLIRGLAHEDSYVRMVVTKRLQAFKHKLVERRELAPKLIALLEDAEPLVRYRAAAILAEMKDRSSLPALVKMLSDADATARAGAAHALGSLGERSAVPPLIERLHDEDDKVQSIAVRALGALGDISAIPALKRRAAEDPQSGIANVCQQVIQELGGHLPAKIEMETLFSDSVLSVGSRPPSKDVS